MNRLVVLLVGLLFAVSAISQDRYLELRTNANAYKDPNRQSEIVDKLKLTTDGTPLLLKLVSDRKENGYYHVEIPGGSGRTGWVYKSLVRGYDHAPAVEKPTPADDSTSSAAGSFGDCSVLFVGGKAPRAPDEATPLCEEDGGVVFFASGYSKRDNHGYWSAYRLDEEQIVEMNENPRDRPNVKFRQNPKLVGHGYVQPRHESYTGTEWDRGHLAPNGAMAWDEDAQKRSFIISNIAPQKPAMNRNIWRCFEYSIREWAENSGSTFVVVGTTRSDAPPISSERDPKGVKINVPSHYLAMVYRSKPTPMAIGVMVPNTDGNLDIRKFIMPVADLEKKTGFRFGIPKSIAADKPDLAQWPTRLVKKELLGKLPKIDQQCPRVDN